MRSIHLSDSFVDALNWAPTPDRSTIFAVSHVGNWKALFPTIKHRFPKAKLDPSVRYPVVFGGDTSIYLELAGQRGMVEFKAHVAKLLCHHDKIFVFDAQRIQCLHDRPDCISNLLVPGKAASLYFRDDPVPSVMKYLRSQRDRVTVHCSTVSSESVSAIATRLSATLLAEAFNEVAADLTDQERPTLNNLKKSLFAEVTPEVEDQFLAGNFGALKMREYARRKIAGSVLRATTPAYSVKSGEDPVVFFRRCLAESFCRHRLPASFIHDISPNLSFVVKSNKRFAEISALTPLVS